jgi:hypothetical protein
MFVLVAPIPAVSVYRTASKSNAHAQKCSWISTDFDVETWPAGFDDYKCIVSVGHDEYYSAMERTQLQRYSDGGGNIAFFSGNLAVWQVFFSGNLAVWHVLC